MSAEKLDLGDPKTSVHFVDLLVNLAKYWQINFGEVSSKLEVLQHLRDIFLIADEDGSRLSKSERLSLRSDLQTCSNCHALGVGLR